MPSGTPVVAVGGPVRVYYGEVGRRLGCEVVFPGGYAQYARVDSGCWGYGDGANQHSVEAHELMHTLGAVQAESDTAAVQRSRSLSARCAIVLSHCTALR